MACYTISPSKNKETVKASAAASKELQSIIFDYVGETLYAYPQAATRLGMRSHELPNGEKVLLDRELPNFSEDIVEARVDSLRGYLERLDAKVPASSLSADDLADRRLLEDALKTETFFFDEENLHKSCPMLHAGALYEAGLLPPSPSTTLPRASARRTSSVA